MFYLYFSQNFLLRHPVLYTNWTVLGDSFCHPWPTLKWRQKLFKGETFLLFSRYVPNQDSKSQPCLINMATKVSTSTFLGQVCSTIHNMVGRDIPMILLGRWPLWRWFSVSKVSSFNPEDIIKRIDIKLNSDKVTLNHTHVFMQRVNYPLNCFTLDLTKYPEISKIGLRDLTFFFKPARNLTRVEINSQA